MLNVAVTVFTAFIVTVHVVVVPEHAPPQLENVDPKDAEAVNVTLVPEPYDSEQSLPQFIPVPVTVPESVPEPVPDLETIRV